MWELKIRLMIGGVNYGIFRILVKKRLRSTERDRHNKRELQK